MDHVIPAVREWLASRTYHHAETSRRALPPEETVTVCVPVRECASTIAGIVDVLVALREAGTISQVLVVDAASEDGTAEIAARHGAEVHQENDLLPDFGPARGKGDAMWRGLSEARGEIVVFLDGDSDDIGPHFVTGLIGAFAVEPRTQFVKAFFRRPFRIGEVSLPEGGGRVTELTARPLLNLFYPMLAGVRQPLAGEFAARRSLLEGIPFATGYAVETVMLLDVYAAVGLDALAQVDLDVRQNAHQSLSALVPMAGAVLSGVASRLEREGRLSGPLPYTLLVPVGDELVERHVPLIERPSIASLRAQTT